MQPPASQLILTHGLGAVILGEEETFLGSASPLSEADCIFLTAMHCIRDVMNRDLAVMVQRPEGLGGTPVEDIETLDGQPDVAILRTVDGVPPLMKFAREEALVWDDLFAAGFPARDIAQVEQGMRALGARGLKGGVTRKVKAGAEPGVRGPAYEVSFAIPEGMSGAPAFIMTQAPARYGFVGICLGNIESKLVVHWEERDEGPGQTYRREEAKVVEYGLVALLHRNLDSTVRVAGGRSLGEIIGFQKTDSAEAAG